MAFSAVCAACSAAAPDKAPPAKSHPVTTAQNGNLEEVFKGPGLVCQEAFAIVLNDGERLTSRDPGLDFMTYAVEGLPGSSCCTPGTLPNRMTMKSKLAWRSRASLPFMTIERPLRSKPAQSGIA